MEVRATLDAIRSSADSVKKWRTDIVSVVVANSELGREAFYLGAEGAMTSSGTTSSSKIRSARVALRQRRSTRTKTSWAFKRTYQFGVNYLRSIGSTYDEPKAGHH